MPISACVKSDESGAPPITGPRVAACVANAAANGHDTAVVCATLGEAGESRIETDDLAALREFAAAPASGD